MIEAAALLAECKARGFGPYVGVPCSFLTPLINCCLSSPDTEYIAANNEGEAIALASGAYLAGRKPVVMFQNSGLGNAINPLTSLNHPFRIPLLLITTLRGEPGIGDEPQHELMGGITEDLLRVAQIAHNHFPNSEAELAAALDAALGQMEHSGLPQAWVMSQGSIAPFPLTERPPAEFQRGDLLPGDPEDAAPELQRLEAIATVAEAIGSDTALIATTGKIGRELFTCAEREGNLYIVGSMGCASSLALGVALHRPARKVVVLDGDGAALMRLEALVSIGHYRPANLVHVILDNRMHESTGGQASLAGTVRFAELAHACGYASAVHTVRRESLQAELRRVLQQPGPHLIDLRVRAGSAANLGRPTLSPPQVKARFMKFLAD